MNLNIASTIKTVKTVITANSPVLLVGTAIAGVVTTGVLAARGGYKARGIVDAARAENDGVEPTMTEKVQLTWLCYAAPVLTGLSTIASVVGVHTIHTKRHAALAGLYAVTTSRLDDMSDKAEEMLGTNKKAQQLRDEVAQRQVDRNADGFTNNEIVITGDGTELCYDEWSGRWFTSSVARIESAINDLNHALLTGERSLNEYYDFVGLQSSGAGTLVGWNEGTKVEARFGAVKAPDGRPAISVHFLEAPRPDRARA